MKVLVLLVSLCASTGLGAPQSQGPRGSSGGSSGSSSNAAAARITRILGSIYSELGDRAEGLSPCVFPFTHNGVTHQACTTDDDFYGMFWCSTKVDSDGVHAYKEWRHCQQSDSLEGGSEITELSWCEDAGGRCQDSDDKCENGLKRKNLCGSESKQDCCIKPKKHCDLGGTIYKNGEFNGDTCMQAICINGQWVYNREINKNCGTCNVDGDPHVHMFDNTTFLFSFFPFNAANEYTFGGEGNFVITQNGKSSSTFGLNANFVPCNTRLETHGSCIQSVKYYQPGITVELVLPKIDPTAWPSYCSTIERTKERRCNIEVKVNGTVIQILNNPVKVLSATTGNVLVFKHNHINGDPNNLLCMNIIGSEGLSVSLCEYKDNFANLYVHSMQTLRKEPTSELYGLCNTYTGITQHNFTLPSGAVTTDVKLFGDSWVV